MEKFSRLVQWVQLLTGEKWVQVPLTVLLVHLQRSGVQELPGLPLEPDFLINYCKTKNFTCQSLENLRPTRPW